MGYNFYVPSVTATQSSSNNAGKVDVEVTVQQIGVAPFYYDLGLGLSCSGTNKRIQGGVDTLMDKGSSRIFKFVGIPATSECLDKLTLSLESSYAYKERPIKFAQKNGTVSFRLPLPPAVVNAPTRAPVVRRVPTAAPTKKPAGSTAVVKGPSPAPFRWVPSNKQNRSPVQGAGGPASPFESEPESGKDITFPSPSPQREPVAKPMIPPFVAMTGAPSLKPSGSDIAIPLRDVFLIAPAPSGSSPVPPATASPINEQSTGGTTWFGTMEGGIKWMFNWSD
jgi:hypothetical protein